MRLELEQKIDAYIREHHYRLINSVLICQHGEIAAERYYNSGNQESRHKINSIWKSIISLCIGICIDQGLVAVDKPVAEYLAAFGAGTHPYHRFMKVRDLLTMSSGIYWNGGVHYHCPMLEQLWHSDDWCEFLADIDMRDYPGRKFVYKEWDVILLSAIITRVSGQPAFDFCRRYLYEPLGISSERWGESPCGINYNHIPGKDHLANLTARELLKLGQVIQGRGMYQGQQIVASDYVDAMCRPAHPEYGYLLWLSDAAVACRGYGGQEIIISNKQDLIFVMQSTASSRGMSYEDVYGYVMRTVFGDADTWTDSGRSGWTG